MIDIRRAKGAKQGLHDLCKYLQKNTDTNKMIEIGCFVGNSTEIFVQYFNYIFCIDPWEEEIDKDGIYKKFGKSNIERQFDENVLRPYQDKIVKIKDLSTNVYEQFNDDSFDFIYIDGDHSYEGVIKDLYCWYSKVKEGGFIGGHDYNNPPHPGVKQAVDEFFKRQPDKTFKDTSWVMQKR